MIKTFLIGAATMAICLPVLIITLISVGIREGITETNKL